MIASISVGDTLKCLFCHEDFELKAIDANGIGEYITCPHCGKSTDIHDYHRGTTLSPQFQKIKDLSDKIYEKHRGEWTKENFFVLLEQEIPGVTKGALGAMKSMANIIKKVEGRH